MANVAVSLKQLAASRFNQDIWSAETRLFEAAANGKDADCTRVSEEGDRIVRAERFSWLCTNREGCAQVTYRGLWIIGANIDGNVDLKGARISFPIVALRCFFNGEIDLRNSRITFLNLEGSSVWRGVNLEGATIDGPLECNGAHFFSEPGAPALSIAAAKIEGNVLFRESFRAEGTVNLASAAIGGNLECDSGQFVSNSEKPALDAYGAKIEGSVLFQGFKAEGGVDLGAVKIGQNLVCDSGRFVSKSEKPALDAYDAKIDRSVFLGDRMVAEGVVRFAHSCVTGDFQWNVSSPDKVTLDLQSATVGKLLNHKKSCWPKPGKLLLNGFVYDQIDDKADANPELELADVQLLWLHQQPRKRL